MSLIAVHKMAKYIKSYKGEEIVESHNWLHPEATHHIEESYTYIHKHVAATTLTYVVI